MISCSSAITTIILVLILARHPAAAPQARPGTPNSYPGEAYTLENGSLARARPALGLPAGTKGYLYCAAKDGHGWLTAQPAMRRARSSLTGCDSPSAARLNRFSVPTRTDPEKESQSRLHNHRQAKSNHDGCPLVWHTWLHRMWVLEYTLRRHGPCNLSITLISCSNLRDMTTANLGANKNIEKEHAVHTMEGHPYSEVQSLHDVIHRAQGTRTKLVGGGHEVIPPLYKPRAQASECGIRTSHNPRIRLRLRHPARYSGDRNSCDRPRLRWLLQCLSNSRRRASALVCLQSKGP